MSGLPRPRLAEVVVLSALAPVVALGVSVALVVGPRAHDADAEHADVPRSSRVRVPRTPSGPRPVVVAWEMSHCGRPTFVLYDDGSWLRDPLENDRCGDALLTGRLAPLARHALHRAFLDTGLASMSAEMYAQDIAGGNCTTIAVHEGGETWIATAVVGLLPRRPRSIHELAMRDAVMPEPGSFALPVSYVRPVPESFLAANDLLVAFDAPAEGRTTVIPAGAEIEAVLLHALGIE